MIVTLQTTGIQMPEQVRICIEGIGPFHFYSMSVVQLIAG